MKQEALLKDKVAIITGASQGIGKAIALKLAEAKMKLVLVGRSQSRLKGVGMEIRARGSQVMVLPADLSHPETPANIIQTTLKRFGHIDILINNAGQLSTKPFEQVSPMDWETLFRVNAQAPFFLCQEALPYLKESTLPRIINIASTLGLKGAVNRSLYCASKHALIGWSRSLALETAPFGIRIHVISPAAVHTEMGKEADPNIDSHELIQPEGVADTVFFLLTHDQSGIIDHLTLRREGQLPNI